MGTIIDALDACCRYHGATIRTDAPVARLRHANGRVRGVTIKTGQEIGAPRVISAINPKTLFAELLDDHGVNPALRRQIAAIPMRGSAFKIVLALDGLPQFAGLPADTAARDVSGVQFRIAPSLDYIERAVSEGLSGIASTEPIMWGLIPSVISPTLAPPGRHLLGLNVWHAPYRLAVGDWETQRDDFGRRCIRVLTDLMPDLESRIVAHRFLDPVAIEAELGLVQSNITRGDMLVPNLFGARPHAVVHNYRTPLAGLFLSGAGTWPGGYVTGIPGFNASTSPISAYLKGGSLWNSSSTSSCAGPTIWIPA